MEVEFPVKVSIGTSSGSIWWYIWTTEEVERKGSTAVIYLMQWVLLRPCTLECTQQAAVNLVTECLNMRHIIMWELYYTTGQGMCMVAWYISLSHVHGLEAVQYHRTETQQRYQFTHTTSVAYHSWHFCNTNLIMVECKHTRYTMCR